MNEIRLLALGAILLLSATPRAFAWRCDRGMVNTGDRASVVRSKCGKPDFIYSDAGVYRRGHLTSIDERWYYNYGPSQLLRVLRLHKGVLWEIDTPAYGFNMSRRRCTPQDIRLGMSAYELIARCGRPRSKRERSAHPGGGRRGRSGGAVAIRTQLWIYDFGSAYLLQQVTISDAQVQSLDTMRRQARRSKQHD